MASSIDQMANPDEWLEQQLARLRMHKQQHDPEIRRRKQQEKLLLDVGDLYNKYKSNSLLT